MYRRFWSRKEVNFKTVRSQICTEGNLMRDAAVTKKSQLNSRLHRTSSNLKNIIISFFAAISRTAGEVCVHIKLYY